jgi:hypothetical protein
MKELCKLRLFYPITVGARLRSWVMILHRRARVPLNVEVLVGIESVTAFSFTLSTKPGDFVLRICHLEPMFSST